MKWKYVILKIDKPKLSMLRKWSKEKKCDMADIVRTSLTIYQLLKDYVGRGFTKMAISNPTSGSTREHNLRFWFRKRRMK